MNTPWGDIQVSDSHAHLFSYSFFQTLAEQMGRPEAVEAVVHKLGWNVPPADNAGLGAQWIAELDRHNVYRCVLMSSLPGHEDAAGEVVRACGGRVYGYFMLNPLVADAQQRSRRAFDELGLRGVCLFPAMHGFSVQDERLEPLYELCSQRDNVVVFVHMGVLTVGVRKKLGLPSKFDMRYSNPMDLHRIALEYPKVNFVIPHFGAGFFRETLMLGDLAGNVYVDTSSTNSWTRYLLPEVTLKDVFRRALEVFGPQRLLFGTDSSFFPRGWNRSVLETQTRILHDLDADAGTARAILGGNLERLLSEVPDAGT